MSTYKIGIDVGGTNTDCVIVDSKNQIISKTKQSTSNDIISGIDNAIGVVLKNSKIEPSQVKYVMLGTTHCTNAIVERKRLNKVGIIRICKPASTAIPPLTTFPEALATQFSSHVYMVHGGFEFDGRPISPLQEKEVRSVLQKMKDKVEAVAIIGVFSKTNPEQELKVAEWTKEELGLDIPITLSHTIGGLGLIERENASILNASLHDIAENMADSFQRAVKKYGIDAQLFFGQNDGTLMSVEQARKYPIQTIACGPTNSIRGAGALSHIKEGIVIDVGGTTADGGVLVKGFPRESIGANEIGGVQTNFRMPDILAIGLGGGTIISLDPEFKIGPESVGYQLKNKALAFGGGTYTLTDYAILEGALNIDDAHSSTELTKILDVKTGSSTKAIQANIRDHLSDMISRLLDKLKTENKDVNVILVGGGSLIIPDNISGASNVIRPEHFEVANAYGACIAKVGGETEQVFNLNNQDRLMAIKTVTDEAKAIAIKGGADPTQIEVLTVNDTPLAYLPNMTKIKVKVCGDLLGTE